MATLRGLWSHSWQHWNKLGLVTDCQLHNADRLPNTSAMHTIAKTYFDWKLITIIEMLYIFEYILLKVYISQKNSDRIIVRLRVQQARSVHQDWFTWEVKDRLVWMHFLGPRTLVGCVLTSSCHVPFNHLPPGAYIWTRIANISINSKKGSWKKIQWALRLWAGRR